MGNSTDKPEEELSLIDSFGVLFKASKAYWLINLINFGDGIAYFGILTLLTIYLGHDLYVKDRVTDTIPIPLWPFVYIMVLGFFISRHVGNSSEMSGSIRRPLRFPNCLPWYSSDGISYCVVCRKV